MLPRRLAGVQPPATICRGGRASEKRQGPRFVVQKASGRSPCWGASNGPDRGSRGGRNLAGDNKRGGRCSDVERDEATEC